MERIEGKRFLFDGLLNMHAWIFFPCQATKLEFASSKNLFRSNLIHVGP